MKKAWLVLVKHEGDKNWSIGAHQLFDRKSDAEAIMSNRTKSALYHDRKDLYGIAELTTYEE